MQAQAAIRDCCSRAVTRGEAAIPLEIIQIDGNTYEVLPRYEGWSLNDIIVDNPEGVSGGLLQRWAEDLAQLVAVLHRHKPAILHRDINPRNVLITADKLRLVLLDFSNAVLADGSPLPNLINSGAFSAPEVQMGRHTTASDVYSLGAVLACLNTGRPPPSATERREHGEHVQLDELGRERLYRGIVQMLEEREESRPTDAARALDVIKRGTTTEAAANTPPPVIGRVRLRDGSVIDVSWRDYARHRVDPSSDLGLATVS